MLDDGPPIPPKSWRAPRRTKRPLSVQFDLTPHTGRRDSSGLGEDVESKPSGLDIGPVSCQSKVNPPKGILTNKNSNSTVTSESRVIPRFKLVDAVKEYRNQNKMSRSENETPPAPPPPPPLPPRSLVKRARSFVIGFQIEVTDRWGRSNGSNKAKSKVSGGHFAKNCIITECEGCPDKCSVVRNSQNSPITNRHSISTTSSYTSDSNSYNTSDSQSLSLSDHSNDSDLIPVSEICQKSSENRHSSDECNVIYSRQSGINVRRKNSHGQTALDIVNKFTPTRAASDIKQMLRGKSTAH